MGKIKGWKKLDEGHYDSPSTIAIYQNVKEKGIIIRLTNIGRYNVVLPNQEITVGNKANALYIATQYMRSHPNG